MSRAQRHEPGPAARAGLGTDAQPAAHGPNCVGSKPEKKCSGDPRAQDLSACAPWSHAWTQTPASACRSLPPCTLSPCSRPVAGPRLAGPHCGLPITLPMWPPVTTAGSSRTRCALGTLWPELSLLEATESMARLEVAGRGTAKIKQRVRSPGEARRETEGRGRQRSRAPAETAHAACTFVCVCVHTPGCREACGASFLSPAGARTPREAAPAPDARSRRREAGRLVLGRSCPHNLGAEGLGVQSVGTDRRTDGRTARGPPAGRLPEVGLPLLARPTSARS